MQMIDIEQLPGGIAPPPVRVGDASIDEATIALEMQYHPAETAGEAQLQAARALVVRELLRQRANVLGLLSTQEASEAQEDAAIAALLEQELEVPEPGEADCQRFFDTHRERFSEPAQLRVRHILLAAAPDDSQGRDDAYQLGEKLLKELNSIPERFAEFAQHHSACPSKEMDGDLGWLVSGQTVPELDRALQHLPEGLHERPLASRYGWHVVSIDERREGRALPFDQVADRVRHSLREQATRRALRHYLLALESEIGVEGIILDDDAGGSLMQ
ncbi:peptidylprolyl isomerase [Halomonas sp. QX-2]|jgi:peptidyl-prolyl cis-trans isomerase C|uniref:peptidylprolyl isomerase n=1 Tax=Vreelandella sedimenti TaxID=2729618 RepID=A0A7Z0SPN0_9GAMM|nr:MULTISPECIES: peptidylprolyl isomerase [Halomonas]NYT72729.1 peptidylprolyl isomerase [Halomonas sedimenti]|tara:strand:- start:45370 stop:46191 length:822 start_codon:yes stop_codon:yes gene_type:complete